MIFFFWLGVREATELFIMKKLRKVAILRHFFEVQALDEAGAWYQIFAQNPAESLKLDKVTVLRYYFNFFDEILLFFWFFRTI